MIRSTEQTLYRLDNLNAEQQRISYQMSTGKKLEQGSDDSNLYTREIYIDDKIRVYEGLKTQIEKTTAQNNVADSTLGEVKNLLTYVKAEVIKALNDTTDPEARAAIAINLAGIKENLYDFANEQVEGEYLYAGSDTQVRPFSKDADGRVIYNGDAFLRKVAVEDGSYRERGITGFETFMYTSSSALKNSTLEFDASERIIDQDGYEWKIEAATTSTAGATLNFASTESLIDQNGKVWTLNDANTELEDGKGNSLSVVAGATAGTYDVVVPADEPAPAETSSLGVINQLVKYDEDGNATSEIRPVTSGVDKAFQITTPNVDGTKFEAKANTFDVMDKIINALNEKDSLGNTVSTDVARASLQEGLGEITEAFEAANVGHAKLGGRNRVFEVSLDRVSTKLTQFNILSQEIGAVDLSKVAVEAKALELTYTALYSTINKMNELSLINFIR
ncbi:flagellar hook-associated protein FlgL [Arcobacter sp. LA11]|uniref:flagellar hook-associated protein FlgL n=1 Tax=Arcobacter sp. LA11 TaxID=1898176 RepID=UPI000934D6E7|nr:flagellar hook-associated protein FlgL [Arcobacter sp. LA11]